MSPKLDFFRHFDRNRCRVEGCTNFPACTGGCPAHGYFHGPDLQGTDIRCASR
jgi:radical SAM protein with 4Fe4S-binding SPASM domain